MRGKRRPGRDDVGMNLFPFLAVLICTMGSLIVLLVVMVQQARVRAQQPVAAASATVPRPSARVAVEADQRRKEYETQLKLAEQRQVEIDELRWKSDVLQTAYTSVTEKVQQQRLVLSHLEAHTRELSEQASRLQAEADLLAQTKEQNDRSSESSRREAEQLQQRVEELTARLETMRKELSTRPKKYSLIPYEGPNGTNRRPMYIECFGDRVVLRPENVELTSDDFGGGPAQESPLALALRAKREFWLEQGVLVEGEEPYPLLIVRPGAASSYAAARVSMTSWESEFGYELVESEVELDFEVADPRLTQTLAQVVEAARERRQQLRMMQQRLRAKPKRELWRPSSQGGFERVSGGGNAAGVRSPVGRSQRAGNPGNGGFGQWGSGVLSSEEAGPGGSGMARAGTVSEARGADLSRGSQASSDSLARLDQERKRGENPGGNGGSDVSSRWNASVQGNGEAAERGTGEDRGRGGGSASTSERGASSADGTQRAADLDQRGIGRSGAASSGPGGPSGRPGANGQAGGTASGGGGSPSTGSGGTPRFESSPNLAASRGKNWAIPSVGTGAVGIRRPIRVLLEQDRLVLVPEKGTRENVQIFRHDGRLQPVIDPFVEAIRDRMQQWGIAGQGIYWRPVVQARLDATSADAYRQLLTLLADSGIEVTVQRGQTKK